MTLNSKYTKSQGPLFGGKTFVYFVDINVKFPISSHSLEIPKNQPLHLSFFLGMNENCQESGKVIKWAGDNKAVLPR